MNSNNLTFKSGRILRHWLTSCRHDIVFGCLVAARLLGGIHIGGSLLDEAARLGLVCQGRAVFARVLGAPGVQVTVGKACGRAGVHGRARSWRRAALLALSAQRLVFGHEAELWRWSLRQ